MDDRLEPGCIIFDRVTDTKPPKDKYFIIVGVTSDELALATVYINTDINPNIFRTQRLRDLHVTIPRDENPFLSWDSFVDCSMIHEKSVQVVKDCLDSNNPRYGYISNVDPITLELVTRTVTAAFTIPMAQKSKFSLL
jgi:hypothetical protein